jgi:CelD/BcsL family acetyltransferase involved in cellulose biosynthesis
MTDWPRNDLRHEGYPMPIMGITVNRIDSLEYISRAEQDWRRVLRSSGEDDIFLTPEWQLSWWETMGGDRRPIFLDARVDGRTVGIAPLMLSTRGRVRTWRKLEFAATGPSDRLGVLAEDGRADVQAAIWKFVLEQKWWDVLELREMNKGGPTEMATRTAFAEGDRGGQVCPYVMLSSSYAGYVESLTREVRHNISRYSKRLDDLGVAFRVVTDERESKQALADLARINSERWKQTGTGAFGAPGMRSFLERLIERFSGRHIVAFHGLWDGSAPVAVVMGFFYRERYLYYIPGFDPKYSKYSPGTVMHAKIIEDTFNRGLKEVDFLRGDETHKYKYNALDRRNVHVRVFNSGLVRRLEGKAREGILA